MKIICRDLREFGLTLIPLSSPEYEEALQSVLRLSQREAPSESTEPSAILVNMTDRAVAALWVWFDFETETGRTYTQSSGMLNPKPYLTGQAPEGVIKVVRYWQTIFPGSKRLLTTSGMFGDNRDMRPPTPDEQQFGPVGVRGMRSRGGHDMGEQLSSATLILDGVFFEDGEFVGPNRGRLFERTVADVEANALVITTALNARARGATASEILAEIAAVTGPARKPYREWAYARATSPSPEDFRRWALEDYANTLQMQRDSMRHSDQEIVDHLVRTPVPHLPPGTRRA